jgi:hypothetical protein
VFADRGVDGFTTDALLLLLPPAPPPPPAADVKYEAELLLCRVGVVLAELVTADADIALVCEQDVDMDDDDCFWELDIHEDFILFKTRVLATSANSGAVLNIYQHKKTQHVMQTHAIQPLKYFAIIQNKI